jgi:hypothetical protein
MKTKLRIALAIMLVMVGCTVTKLVENPPGSGKYDKVVEVDPKLTSGLEAAKAVNDAAKPFFPFSPVVDIGLGTVAALAAWFAKRKSDQLKATIVGVEAKGGEAVKTAIKEAAMASGVESGLNKVVKSITGGT